MSRPKTTIAATRPRTNSLARATAGRPPAATNLTANPDGSAELMVYGTIGWDLTAESIVSQLQATTANTINVHINSVGGDVWDATAIYNALRNHGATIVSHVDGIAASCASWIAQAGDEVRIAKTAYMMIHDPSGVAFGTADDMRQMADMLDKVKSTVAQIYADRSGKPAADWASAMSDETWYIGQEAVDAGLADALSDADAAEPAVTNEQAKAFNHAPRGLLAAVQNHTTQTTGPGGKPATSDVATATAATNGGPMGTINLEAFNAFAAENPDAVSRFVNQGKNAGVAEATQAERTRATAIRNACGENHQLALDAIVAGHSVENVQTSVKAVDDEKLRAKNKADADAQAIKERDDKIKDLEGRLELKNSGHGPVGTRGGDGGQGGAGTGGQPAGKHQDIVAWENALKAYTDAGIAPMRAAEKVVNENPELHRKYIEAANAARKMAGRR